MASPPGVNCGAAMAVEEPGTGTMCGPNKNDGSAKLDVFVIVGVTLAIVVKLSG